MAPPSHPVEGQIVLLAGSKASVPLSTLSQLLERTQRHLGERREAYARRFERIDGSDDATYYLAPEGQWAEVGEALGLGDSERDAVERAHAEQFRRDGRRFAREEEFEAALEVRDVIAIAAPSR